MQSRGQVEGRLATARFETQLRGCGATRAWRQRRLALAAYGLGQQHHGREGISGLPQSSLMPDLRPIFDKRGSPRLGVENAGCGR